LWHAGNFLAVATERQACLVMLPVRVRRFWQKEAKPFVSLPAARRGRSVEGGGCVGHCRCRAAGGRAGAPLPSLTPSA